MAVERLKITIHDSTISNLLTIYPRRSVDHTVSAMADAHYARNLVSITLASSSSAHLLLTSSYIAMLNVHLSFPIHAFDPVSMYREYYT